MQWEETGLQGQGMPRPKTPAAIRSLTVSTTVTWCGTYEPQAKVDQQIIDGRSLEAEPEARVWWKRFVSRHSGEGEEKQNSGSEACSRVVLALVLKGSGMLCPKVSFTFRYLPGGHWLWTPLILFFTLRDSFTSWVRWLGHQRTIPQRRAVMASQQSILTS